MGSICQPRRLVLPVESVQNRQHQLCVGLSSQSAKPGLRVKAGQDWNAQFFHQFIQIRTPHEPHFSDVVKGAIVFRQFSLLLLLANFIAIPRMNCAALPLIPADLGLSWLLGPHTAPAGSITGGTAVPAVAVAADQCAADRRDLVYPARRVSKAKA
jgi:hypothetical protein